MVRRFFQDQGGSAAEFALILPLSLALLFGIIDSGRYFWEINRAEKATQAGARLAAVTAMIPQGVANYAYSLDAGLPQGSAVGEDYFTGVECTGTSNTTVDCGWTTDPDDPYDLEPDNCAFEMIVTRMRDYMPTLQGENVSVLYTNSGLGFAGDPSGPDVAPLVTVRIVGMEFRPILTSVFGLGWGLPTAPYTLTQEDGTGQWFEEFDGADFPEACA